MNLSLIEHHGGNSSQLIWIKYFTIQYKHQKNIKSDQNALNNFIDSFNYFPVSLRSVKKKIEKAKNVVELEESLADLFSFNKIPLINFLLFTQIVLEQKSMVQQSPYAQYIPDFVMRGFIVTSYNLHTLVHQYISGEPIENFQPELWKLIHLPLLYLLQNKGDIFDDTIKIIDKYFDAFACIDALSKLPLQDPLRKVYFSFLNLILSTFSLELSHGSTKCINFLICSFLSTSDKITNYPESVEIMKSSSILFQNLIPFADSIGNNTSKSLIEIYANILSQAPSFLKSPDNDAYTFVSSGLSLLTKIAKNIDDKNGKQLTQCLINFLGWLLDYIPFDDLYEIDKKPEKEISNPNLKAIENDKSCTSNTNETDIQDSNSLEHWSTYFSNESLLPPSPTLKVKNSQISKILNTFKKLMEETEGVSMTMLETFRCCVDILEYPRKTQLSIFFFTSLYGSKIAMSNISQSFLLLSMFPDAFPSSSKTQISDLNWQYHELFLQVLFEFACQQTENLVYILNIIQIIIHDIEFNKIIDFLQLFRSLVQVDSQINFVHYFLESNIIETCHSAIFKLTKDGTLLKQIAALLQTIAFTRPIEAFSSASFLQLLHSFLLIDNDYTAEMIAPCFKIGMSLSHSPPLKQGRFAAQSTLEQVFSILKQTPSKESEKKMINISMMMISYINESIPSFDLSILTDLVKQGFFETIAKVPFYIKTTESFLTMIKLFMNFNIKFPQAVLSMLTKTQTLSIIKEVEMSAKQVVISKEIIDTLVTILFNEQVLYPTSNKPIQNSLIIPMLLHIIEDTEFEEYLMKIILNICKNSVDNTYEFFSNDLIGFVLQRIIKEKYINLNIEIFKWVCLHFFSPLTLNQFFKAMRLPLDGKKHQYHQLLMNTFLDLIISDKKPPVSNYFHFFQKSDGIVMRFVSNDIFSFPFCFATTFKIEFPKEQENHDSIPLPKDDLENNNNQENDNQLTLSSPMIPILTIKEKENIYFSIFIKDSSLVLVYMGHIIKEINVPIVKSKWYKLIIVFQNSSIQISIDNNEYEPIQVSKHEFQHHLSISFGCISGIKVNIAYTSGTLNIDKKNEVQMKPSKVASQHKFPVVILPDNSASLFHEFFGPTVFMKYESMQKLEMNYEQLNATRKYPKRAIMTFVPWCVKKTIINDVIEQGDSHPFFGYAVSSYSTITSIVQFDGIFQCFFPLFVLVNHPFDKKIDFTNDETFFYSVLISFQRILSLSENVQRYFEQLGGFQLLVGFFGQIKAEFFTKVVIADLALIYRSLLIDSLKHQMIEYIWLNFDLWKEMDGEFQINFYNEYLSLIIDAETIKDSQIKSFDFILYMIQDSFPDKVRQNPNLFFFPTKNQFVENQFDTSVEIPTQKISSTFSLSEIDTETNKAEGNLSCFNSSDILEKRHLFYLNKPCKLEEDEKETIRELQWNFFDKCIELLPSASTIVNVSLVMSFHNDIKVRLLAFQLIEKFIKSGSPLISVVMDTIKSYESFLTLVLDPNVEIEYHAIKCVFLLGEQEIASNFKSKTIDISSAAMSLTLLLVQPEKIGEKLFDLSISFIFDSVETDEDFNKPEHIKMAKILPFVSQISRYGNKEKVLKFAHKLQISLDKHLDSYVTFLEIKSWPYWLFLFTICLYENDHNMVKLVEFLSSALFPFILEGKEFCINALISLFERLGKFFSIQFDRLIVNLFTSLCDKMIDKCILSLSFVSIMIRMILFRFKREEITDNDLDKITFDKMGEFLKFFMNQNIKDSDIQFVICKRSNEEIPDYVFDSSLSLLRFLSLLNSYDVNNNNYSTNNVASSTPNMQASHSNNHHSRSRSSINFVNTHIIVLESLPLSSYECFCYIFDFIKSYGKQIYIEKAQSILDQSINESKKMKSITIVRSHFSVLYRSQIGVTKSNSNSSLNQLDGSLLSTQTISSSSSSFNYSNVSSLSSASPDLKPSSPSSPSNISSIPLPPKNKKKNHENNLSSVQAMSLISFYNTYSTHYLYQNLEDKVCTPEFFKSHHDEFIILCSSDSDEIKSSLLSMVMMVSKKSQIQFNESFNEFVKAYSKTRLIVSLHNHKMASSFFREVTGNFGPWSYSSEDVKWIKTTKIDACGRNIFMKVNRNFDDHRKASALRKSYDHKINETGGNSLNPNEEEYMSPYSSNVGNFKRILNQKDFSFIPAPIEQSKAKSAFAATQISLTKRVSGTLYVYNKKIIFDGNNFMDSFGNPLKINYENHKYIEFSHSSITFIFWRKILHLDVGVEIITTNNTSYLFSFNSNKKRTEFLEIVKKTIDKHVTRSSRPFELLRNACNSCVQTMPPSELLAHSKITKMWQTREITNFTYLFFLNIIAGRSFNDVSQYPIYPWIISDYDCEELNLYDSRVYRDLSKPIGALNEKSLARLKIFMEDCQDPSQFCLYRTHYSAPAFVIGYLIRTEPFSTLHIMLQGGCYDLPERLFHSIPGTWKSILKVDQNDYRELIPEFFCQHTFLKNNNGFDLGVLTLIDDDDDDDENEIEPVNNDNAVIDIEKFDSFENEANNNKDENEKIENESNINDENVKIENESNINDENVKIENESNINDGNVKIENESNNIKDESVKIENESNNINDENAKIENESNNINDGNVKIENESNIKDENVKIENELNNINDENAKIENDVVESNKDENNMTDSNFGSSKNASNSTIDNDPNQAHFIKKRRRNIDDVKLPKWAKTPYEFIEIHKKALESEEVSRNLHNWIDLIFGVNQRSIEHNNVFHPYTYSDSLSSLNSSSKFDDSGNNSSEVGLTSLLDQDSETFAVIQSYAANFGVCPTCLFNSPHVHRDPGRLFMHTSYQLPTFEDDIVMCKSGSFLTKKTTLYRIKTNSSISTPQPINENIIDFNKEHLFVLSRGGTTISCVSFKTGDEVGTLSHNNNSVINCLFCVGNRAILTGGADCAVCVWVPHSLKLGGSIPLHSLPISCVFGDSKFDFIVAIDINHNVFFHTLKSLKFIYSFKLKNCPSDSKHMIRMTRSGLVIILCTSPFGEQNSSIQIFDLYGNLVKRLDLNEHVVRIDTNFTSLNENIFMYTTSDNIIYIYDILGFKLIKTINEFIDPRFVCPIGQDRSLIAAKIKQNKGYELVQYDF